MKLTTSIEYRTVWGQELFLRMAGRLYPMEYKEGGIWTACIGSLKAGQSLEYRYEVHRSGVCIRTEWFSHQVELPAKGREFRVRDSWSDVPENLPLKTEPFRTGVFHLQEGRQWKGAGTAVPVFSLRSSESFGVGDFHDLKLLVDWAAKTGQKVIQLLPVNDTTMTHTWEDSYPYNAVSSFALHPQFLYLPAVGVEESEEYLRLRDELNALDTVDYERVNDLKHKMLRQVFSAAGSKLKASEAYKDFMKENSDWLLPYSDFCCRRDEFKNAGYYCFLQYHLHTQLKEARDYAHSKGVVFKGDLPIGVSRTSVDALVNPDLYHLDSQAGAPPDAFSVEGQNWGFPTYDWEAMSRDGYAWWKARLRKMSEYFDAFRIDHILGFFRIWEIPMDAVHGLLGHFSPALPYSTQELSKMGFDMDLGRYSQPYFDDELIEGIFKEAAPEVRKKCFKDGKLKKEYSTQRKVLEKFRDNETVRDGLMHILDDVIFVEDPRKKGMWHPRIAAQFTYSYSHMDDHLKRVFDRLYDDFFYHRHNAFWKASAMAKLPPLLSATGMLTCGEDLGMIPGCVPEIMSEYSILSLEIQRMPKDPAQTFAEPAWYPYYSVCTTSTHDMNPLRAWWEEDRELTNRFWRETLKEQGEAPLSCEPWICEKIVKMHLDSPAMLTILPLQDWLSMDGSLRREDPAAERINVPAIPRYYWRYRMHINLETLLAADTFNTNLRQMIAASGR